MSDATLITFSIDELVRRYSGRKLIPSQEVLDDLLDLRNTLNEAPKEPNPS